MATTAAEQRTVGERKPRLLRVVRVIAVLASSLWIALALGLGEFVGLGWLLPYATAPVAGVVLLLWILWTRARSTSWPRSALFFPAMLFVFVLASANPWNFTVVGGLVEVALPSLVAFLVVLTLAAASRAQHNVATWGQALALAAAAACLLALWVVALTGFYWELAGNDHGPTVRSTTSPYADVSAIEMSSWSDPHTDPVWLVSGTGPGRRQMYLCADSDESDMVFESADTVVLSGWHGQRRIVFDPNTLAVLHDSSAGYEYSQFCT